MYKFKNKGLLVVVLLLVLIFALTACKNTDEGLVATVDGEEITVEQFNSEFQVFKTLYEQQLGQDAMSQTDEEGRTFEERLKENIIEKLIIENIIASDAKNKNIVVTEDEIKVQMDEYIKLMEGQEKFDEFLKEKQLTKEFFEKNLSKELLLSKHREAYLNEVEATDKEAEEYFNENKEKLIVVKASHILVKTEEEGKKILERLGSGEDFASLAKAESIDSASATSGGSLGYFKKGNMIAEFEEAAFDLEVGEISDLVKTEVGYHIIYVEDRKDTFEDLKDDIIIVLKDDKYLNELDKLRENAKVKIILDTKSK
ncbi:peptidylprolyl isomerase [Tissierella sp.]|uniref:peptidylprolyl isomerase n=1 Tax=Tissierella sp. TaxID=41274 RepID=UPI00286734AE|nr:peptidylprolyl isomerase [Tissierella sp.]MDR7855668.1 peptidylprolyl isomerase [Tissierella sp.]